jgi:SAM-dependent methyltransferase
MYGNSAVFYDAVWGSRIDFAAGAEQIRSLASEHKISDGSTLLDVACGTGAYLVHLRDHFAVEGLDISPQMVSLAREKLPDVQVHQADMVNFDLGKRFDVIICLGSSIGYTKTINRLEQTAKTFAQHLRPGGVFIVEPWFGPDVWEDGRVTADLLDKPNLKIARILVSGLSDRGSTLDIYHLIASGTSIDQFTEHHELGLFTHEQYVSAFQNEGFTVEHDPIGLNGRGLYFGTKLC